MDSGSFQSVVSEAVSLLNATMLESSWQKCRFEQGGMSVSLEVVEGVAGSHIVGKAALQKLHPEMEPTRLLYAMYMNSKLPDFFGLPLWFALDPESDELQACFGLPAAEISAETLVQALTPLGELANPGYACP